MVHAPRALAPTRASLAPWVRAGGLALAFVLATWPALAAAAERGARVAILATVLPGPHGAADPAEVSREIARSAALHLGLRLVPESQLLVEGPEPLAETVRGCASDEACLGRALAGHDLELGVRAIVNFAIDPPLVSLSVINAHPARVLTESITELSGGVGLDVILRRESSLLFERTGFPRAGRVVVSVRPVDAVLHVEGAEEGEQPGVFVVPPGTWRVHAERDGHAAKEVSVEVAAGAEVPVELVLDPSPGLTASPWFWAAVGVAAAAVATTTVLIATDPFAAPPATGCVCITTAAGGCAPCR